MLYSSFIFIAIIFCGSFKTSAQRGPGGVGDLTGNSSLKLWLRADTGIIKNIGSNKVTSWSDMSGADNNLSSVTDEHPTYEIDSTFSCILFNGNQEMISLATHSFFRTKATIFIVEKGPFQGVTISLAPSPYNDEMLILNKAIYHESSTGSFSDLTSNCLDQMSSNVRTIICGQWNEDSNKIHLYINGKKNRAFQMEIFKYSSLIFWVKWSSAATLIPKKQKSSAFLFMI